VGSAVTERDAWDQLGWLWHGLFAATLAMPTLIAVADPDPTARSKVLVVGIAAALLLAHWLVVARHPDWWEVRIRVLGAYWVVPCVLVALLATQHGSYTIALYGLYPMMIMTLGWWGMVPVVGVTALMGVALGGWGSGQAFLTNLLASAGLAALIAAFVSAISRQSEQRRAALAELAATRAELAEASRQAGVVTERARLARELHDTVAQGFVSVVTQLESAEQALETGEGAGVAQARTSVHKARETARTSLEELRRSVRALRPDLLETASLPQALAELVRRWSTGSTVAAELRTTGQAVPLHPDAELALLRSAQEALTNISRHARASRVVVTLSYLEDVVSLDVDDDGVGFVPPNEPAARVRADGGFGLIGMRERLTAAGGTLAIESSPGHGTTIAASVPA
jgi:signal transduction histidine kinase